MIWPYYDWWVVLMLGGPSKGNGMAELTPGEWWKNFCIEQASLKSQPLVIFQKLVRATEIFRPDDHRRDPALVKIWLAYLEAH